jgi:hypothetical protein
MATAAPGNQRSPADDEAARKVRIRAAFDMFDKEKKGSVIQECVFLQSLVASSPAADNISVEICREVSTIMRYLGAYPTEKDIIKKILPEVSELNRCTCNTSLDSVLGIY